MIGGVLLQFMLIALGSALGGVGRFWLTGWVTRAAGGTFPWGTLLVNISGCLLIGLFASLTGPQGRAPMAMEWRQFMMIGICGGYTTFSSFALTTLTMLQNGEFLPAFANVMGSVALCLVAVWLGHLLALHLNPA